MSSRSFSSLAILLAIGTQAQAAPVFKFNQKVFARNSSQACQIERFTMTSKREKMNDTQSLSYFTSMAAVIETTKSDCIREYAVVQWIRGCVSNQTFRKSTSELSPKFYGSSREFRGGNITFDHPEWTVDTTDVDPMYQSNSSGHGERTDWYYVSKQDLKLKSDRASMVADDDVYQRSTKRYFLQNPRAQPTSQTIVTDMPDTANYYHEAQYDVGLITTPSLEFQVCLYETKDIPTSGDPAGPQVPHEIGGPLQCYAWDHKFNFNPVTKDFDRVTTPGIDPFCLSPTPTPDPSEANGEAPRVIGQNGSN